MCLSSSSAFLFVSVFLSVQGSCKMCLFSKLTPARPPGQVCRRQRWEIKGQDPEVGGS